MTGLRYDHLVNYRQLGRTGWKVSAISFGAWAIGGSWGEVDDSESLAALEKAVDCGVNFIDTADVYGMGRSERLIAQFQRAHKADLKIATKAGRKLSPHAADHGNGAQPARRSSSLITRRMVDSRGSRRRLMCSRSASLISV